MKGEEARTIRHNVFGEQLTFNKKFEEHVEKLKEGMVQDSVGS